MPKVSVVIPVYNCQDYIGRCIESLQCQTLKDIEVILVNDCTPDNAMDVIHDYEYSDKRIKIVAHKINLGPMMARYYGYSIAKGDYITFVDSDDTLPLDALEKLLNRAEGSGADVVSGVVVYIRNDGRRELWPNTLSDGNNIECVFKSMLSNEFMHNLCSRLFRRSILQNYNYKNYDNMRNGEDGLLFYQIIGNCSSIVTTDDVVYEYWQNNESSSQRYFSESQIDSYLFTCKEQALIAGKYKSLEVFIGQFVARSIIVLYEKGCHREMIRRYVNKYDLSKYDTYISLLKLFPLKIAVKYCIKKMICPMIRKNY